MRKSIFCGIFLILGACDSTPDNSHSENGNVAEIAATEPDAGETSFAQEARPADAQLAAKYDRSCRTCHSLVDSKAPLTGHRSAWDLRYDTKTVEGLLASTKTGLNAMPPMGLCNDCSDEEFIDLIAFMAGRIEP